MRTIVEIEHGGWEDFPLPALLHEIARKAKRNLGVPRLETEHCRAVIRDATDARTEQPGALLAALEFYANEDNWRGGDPHEAEADGGKRAWDALAAYRSSAGRERDGAAGELQREVGEWGCVTFPRATKTSIVKHLREEVNEIDGAVLPAEVAEECADACLMLLHLAHRSNFDLLAEAQRKFAAVKDSEWGYDAERGYSKRRKPGAAAAPQPGTRTQQFAAMVRDYLRDEGLSPSDRGCGWCHWQSGDHDPDCLWDQAEKLAAPAAGPQPGTHSARELAAYCEVAAKAYAPGSVGETHLREAAAFIRVAAAEPQPGARLVWRRTSEELPVVGERVLALFDPAVFVHNAPMSVLKFHNTGANGWSSLGLGYSFEEVSHWMPRPAAPGPGGGARRGGVAGGYRMIDASKTTVAYVQPGLWMATAWNGNTAYPCYGTTREEAIIRAEAAAAEPVDARHEAELPRTENTTMGVEYALYDRGRKVYIELGKRFAYTFQAPSEDIVRFLADASRGEGPLEIVCDSEEQPHEKEPGWLLIGHWAHEHNNRCICGLCDPSGEKADNLPSRPWTDAEIAEWERAQDARVEAHVRAASATE